MEGVGRRGKCLAGGSRAPARPAPARPQVASDAQAHANAGYAAAAPKASTAAPAAPKASTAAPAVCISSVAARISSVAAAHRTSTAAARGASTSASTRGWSAHGTNRHAKLPQALERRHRRKVYALNLVIIVEASGAVARLTADGQPNETLICTVRRYLEKLVDESAATAAPKRS